jgi:hypothetical protein
VNVHSLLVKQWLALDESNVRKKDRVVGGAYDSVSLWLKTNEGIDQRSLQTCLKIDWVPNQLETGREWEVVSLPPVHRVNGSPSRFAP